MNLLRILPKVIYLISYMVLGSYTPFLNAFMLSVGFSATQAGFISGIRNVFCVFGVLWNTLADYTKYRRLIMAVELFGMVMFYAPLPLVPKYLCHLNGNITDNTSIYKLPDNTECVNKIHLTIMLMIFAASIFDFALIASIDALIVQCVRENANVGSFGEQRWLASFGFGMSSLLIPVVIDKIKIEGFSEYLLPFGSMLFNAIILLPFAMTLVSKLKFPNSSESNNRKSRFKIVVSTISNDCRISTVFIVVLINGIGVLLVGNFLYIFFTKDLKLSDTIAGIGITIPCLCEIVVFAISDYLIKYFGGPKVCLILGGISFMIRFLIMALLENVIVLVSIQALHAIGFALYWAAAVEILKENAPVEVLTSIVSLLSILQSGVSNLIANMLGGFVYDHYGGKKLFLYAYFLYVTLTVFLMAQFVLEKVSIHKRYKELTEDDTERLVHSVE